MWITVSLVFFWSAHCFISSFINHTAASFFLSQTLITCGNFAPFNPLTWVPTCKSSSWVCMEWLYNLAGMCSAVFPNLSFCVSSTDRLHQRLHKIFCFQMGPDCGYFLVLCSSFCHIWLTLVTHERWKIVTPYNCSTSLPYIRKWLWGIEIAILPFLQC